MCKELQKMFTVLCFGFHTGLQPFLPLIYCPAVVTASAGTLVQIQMFSNVEV